MPPKKNCELEYLRAVAIILVLYTHLPAVLRWDHKWWTASIGWFSPGTGVDLFFCISGYIISKSLFPLIDAHRAAGTPGTAVLAFWLKRAFRLLPSAWFWAAFTVGCCLLYNRTGNFATLETNIKSTMGLLTYTANFLQAKGKMGIMGQYWSLSLEEQFYIVLPLFLLAVTGAWRLRVILALLALHAYLGWVPSLDPIWRINAALYGVLVYHLERTALSRLVEPAFLRNRAAAIAVSVFLVALIAATPIQLNDLAFNGTILGICCAVLVWLATFQKGYVFSLPGMHRILMWIGSRSYGIYLLHIPAFLLAYEYWWHRATERGVQVGDVFAARTVFTGFALVVIFAELNFRFIEEPLRKRGNRIAERLLHGQPAATGRSAAAARDAHIAAPSTAARI